MICRKCNTELKFLYGTRREEIYIYICPHCKLVKVKTKNDVEICGGDCIE